MSPRISIILALGILAGGALYYGADYLAWRNRYPTSAQLRDEDFRKQMAADIAALRASAKTKEEKMLISFWYDRDLEKERKRFRVSDGIDQYEAWMLATTYFSTNLGSCGNVELPAKEGGSWRVAVAIGRNAAPGTIFIDATSGVIHCSGHPTVTDAEAFLLNPEPPNKAPEPTAMSVTSPAAQEPRQP